EPHRRHHPRDRVGSRPRGCAPHRTRARTGRRRAREPLGPRRQGRRDRGSLVRPLRRRGGAGMSRDVSPSVRSYAGVSATLAQRKGLRGYFPFGFPDLQTSIDAAVALVENGFDAIELGLPYSDPVMDGLTIQKATQQALANGFRVRDVFTAIEAVR